MFFAGIGLFAAAVVAFLTVKPRNGLVNPLAARSLLGDLVALGITVTEWSGMVVMIVGLGRL